MTRHITLLLLLAAASFGCGSTESQTATVRGLPEARESASLPDGGPTSHGLQLRFAVVDDETTAREKHALELTLLNASDRAITLVSDPILSTNEVADYEEALARGVWFSTYPAVPFEGSQWIARDPVPVRPKTLRPGEDLRLRWEVAADRVHSEIVSERENAGFRFASDGLYFVRAGADLKTEGGREVRLWSNEVAYVVGSKRTIPKPPSASVVECDEKTGEAVLGVGRRDGTEVGDVYDLGPRMGSWWRLTVYEVGADRSRARVERFGTPSRYQPRPYPKEGDSLVLARPE